MTQMPTPPPTSDSSRSLRFRAVNDPTHEQDLQDDPGAADPATIMDDTTMRDGHSPSHSHRADAGPELTRRAVGPRLYHKKSRMGCLRCKARRVKCDEARPVCSGCSRHLVECVYPSRGGPSYGSARQDAAGISLQVTRAESSSGHSDQGFSPNASSASVPPGSESWNRTPGPELHSLPVPVEPGGFSPMTPGYTPYSASQGLTPPHIGGYPPSGALPALSSRAPSVISNSSSSQTGSIVREANDYLSHLTDPEILDIPESKERRIWELRLMHNYMANAAQQFAGTKAEQAHGPQPTPSVALEDSEVDDPPAGGAGGAFPRGAFLWGREIPLLAFEDDAILYSLLASSALNMWTKSGDARERDELRLCQQKYLSMALREQRQAVGNLSRDNADNVCMSSLTILQNSFALVQTLPVRPWQPPLEWLRMGKGAGSVLTVARGYLGFNHRGDGSGSGSGSGGAGSGGGGDKTTRFLNSMPRMDPDEMFTAANRAHLEWVLDNDRGSTDAVGDHELQDKVTHGIYNRVLSYVGSVQKAMADGEPLYALCRRFIGFAVWMPEVYHDFLTQRRPRALITLAHFFKLWIPYDDLWLIGKTGENQVRGIQEALPPQWRHKVDIIFEEYYLSPG